ncbi:MAG: nucleotidyltransferase domain-containing protein [Candidatus Yanofskybacteria bacterium]|nr:nucleotidyltransferase domain-containing protein [Candidatus Yanofskybacteria bacterium]
MNQIDTIKAITIPILKKYGVERASLFGSIVRGEDNSGSDIDILVSIKKPIGIFEFMGLQFALEEALKKRVDLVSDRAVNKYIQPYIEKDLVVIYEGN